jgi:predicted nucleotidyltransferase
MTGKANLTSLAKELILGIEPLAEVFLYGTAVHGDAVAGLDWDFFVLVEGPVDSARADRVRHALYRLESEAGSTVRIIVKNKQEWNDPKHKHVPLYKRIRKEGIRL